MPVQIRLSAPYQEHMATKRVNPTKPRVEHPYMPSRPPVMIGPSFDQLDELVKPVPMARASTKVKVIKPKMTKKQFLSQKNTI